MYWGLEKCPKMYYDLPYMPLSLVIAFQSILIDTHTNFIEHQGQYLGNDLTIVAASSNVISHGRSSSASSRYEQFLPHRTTSNDIIYTTVHTLLSPEKKNTDNRNKLQEKH